PVPPPAPEPEPPTPEATPVEADVVPLYRIETPTYAVVPPAAHMLMAASLGTFHERRGEQDLLRDGGPLPSSWARAFGQGGDRKWAGTVAPTFDGDLSGYQIGQDLAGWGRDGHANRLGVLLGQSRMRGDVRGQALGWNDLDVGTLRLENDSLGAYWTHVGPSGWYLDGVVMVSRFDGRAVSSADMGIEIEGDGVTASFEGGYPIAMGAGWSLEPQAQVVWNRLSLDDQADLFATVVFDAEEAVTGRLGLRLQRDPTGADRVRPYLKANLWRDFGSDQTLALNGDEVVSDLKGTSVEVGGGVVANLTSAVSVHAVVDYTANVDGERRRIVEGSVGLTVRW
ncbi:MAG: autotransporter outer membrane beta-barrel domain-containing protein, partial [Brevundimonas sp.]